MRLMWQFGIYCKYWSKGIDAEVFGVTVKTISDNGMTDGQQLTSDQP